ncbi:MAG: hypothetical protein R2705_11210 [Ilumatobacteraceae bacterium]
MAQEVKELSRATAGATADIAGRITAIQTDAEAAVEAINQITEIIAQISETQSTIAAAVEEQTATTNEMNRSISEASSGSGEIAGNLGEMARLRRKSPPVSTRPGRRPPSCRTWRLDSELVGTFRR